MWQFGKYIVCNVLWLALSGVAPTPSHYKYNKTFHSAADFPQENPEIAIEANRCYQQFFYVLNNSVSSFSTLTKKSSRYSSIVSSCFFRESEFQR